VTILRERERKPIVNGVFGSFAMSIITRELQYAGKQIDVYGFGEITSSVFPLPGKKGETSRFPLDIVDQRRSTPEAFAVWVAMASINAGDRQS